MEIVLMEEMVMFMSKILVFMDAFVLVKEEVIVKLPLLQYSITLLYFLNPLLPLPFS